jgi:chromate transporter
MSRHAEIFLTALRLGCMSFGGPIAHLSYFRNEYVGRKQWLDDARYSDIVALCQFLPGPASSQVGFAVGIHRGGILGGMLAWLGFTLPSAALMIGFALGIGQLGDFHGAGWLRGLKIAAVAVVAEAVWKMAGKLCPDAWRQTMALAAAAVLLLIHTAWAQGLVIVLGAVAGVAFFRDSGAGGRAEQGNVRLSRRGGLVALTVFALLLVGLPAWNAAVESPVLAVVDTFYRAGSLVFGGGHVVLPLLDTGVVVPGWMDQDTFLAGYGGAQALPGPLFAFSAYLGAALNRPPNGVAGGVVALLAIYVPSWLLVLGILPFWDRLRVHPAAQSALKGANAVVVGILLAALYEPVWTAAISDAKDVMVMLLAAAILFVWKRPAWVAVLASAATGWLLLG